MHAGLRDVHFSLLVLTFAACAASTGGSGGRDASSAGVTVLANLSHPAPAVILERVTTKVPFPRGLVLKDDGLYVLCRGRVRDYGGVTAAINDQAGTLYRIDPSVVEPASSNEIGEAVRSNGVLVAEPAPDVFRLWDRTANPPSSDRMTDRPYCGLRFHPPTHSFYLCAFSGVDLDGKPRTFSKNLSDAILRYDLRTSKWYEVERHDVHAGGNYPHHDPAHGKAPHGWLNGPDNCLAVGNWLYAVAKDNSRLVRYDLAALTKDPEAGPPPSEFVLGEHVATKQHGTQILQGHSMLAYRDGYLYLGTRTSGHIVRFAMSPVGEFAHPMQAELIAQFDPYDPTTKKSANMTDMDLGPDGACFVVSASPARIYRFVPDPARVVDGRSGKLAPFADLAALTNNPKMKSENVLCAPDGSVYVTSGDSYAFHAGSGGVVWRLRTARNS
jgi:hypothetical protein